MNVQAYNGCKYGQSDIVMSLATAGLDFREMLDRLTPYPANHRRICHMLPVERRGKGIHSSTRRLLR